jgi:signal peptidase I
MIHWFSPGWLKKADRFSKGVKKFIAYQRDLMPEDRLAEVQAAKSEYDAAMKAKNRAVLEGDDGLEKKLLKMCEKAVPDYNSSPLKENVEVIIVAIIVALGIRAYYLQPFKIPTSSMQPTLNGIIGHRMGPDEATPNIVSQAWEFAWAGRNYTEARVPEEWGDVELVSYQQKSKANFFTFTTLNFSNGKSLTMYAPAKQLLTDLCHVPAVATGAPGIAPDDNPRPVEFSRQKQNAQGQLEFTMSPERRPIYVAAPIPLKAGTLIAKGWVESGDQLLVDKVSYHFTRPERDDVFVFTTKDIPNMGKPQHYIKRLTALPGDRLRIEPPLLYINGEKAQGHGVEKVMSEKDGYRGYGVTGQYDYIPYLRAASSGTEEVTLGDKQYMAMGDNSYASSDSRYWGPVPEKNLVGPALFVYWPFKQHFGIIR